MVNTMDGVAEAALQSVLDRLLGRIYFWISSTARTAGILIRHHGQRDLGRVRARSGKQFVAPFYTQTLSACQLAESDRICVRCVSNPIRFFLAGRNFSSLLCCARRGFAKYTQSVARFNQNKSVESAVLCVVPTCVISLIISCTLARPGTKLRGPDNFL